MEKLNEILEPLSVKLNEALGASQIEIDFKEFVFQGSNLQMITAINDIGEEVDIDISINDDITILSKIINFGDSRLTHVPLTIQIGIGECHIEHGIYSVSKCSAKLLYNSDLELVDIDFYFKILHKL